MHRHFMPHDFEADIMSIENDDSGRRNPETSINDGEKYALVDPTATALERIAFGGLSLSVCHRPTVGDVRRHGT
jgi:hypothetical protein